MPLDLTSLKDQVTRTTTIKAGLLVLLEKAKADPAVLQATIDELKSDNDELETALVTGTPVDPNAP